MVKLKDNTENLSKLNELAAVNNVEVVGSSYANSLLFILSASKESKGNALEMANAFHESGLFEYAEPNFLMMGQPKFTNDPYYTRQWAIHNLGPNIPGYAPYTNPSIAANTMTFEADMDVDDAWAMSAGQGQGEGVVVAVIDDGVDFAQPDLAGRFVPNYGYDALDSNMGIPANQVGLNGSYSHDDAHGTAISGIIAANHNTISIAGIAPKSKILPIRIFYTIPNTSPSVVIWSPESIAKAFKYAICNGADIINCSWGFYGYSSTTIEDAIIAAADNGRDGRGSVVLFAVGNQNTSSLPFPANSPNLEPKGYIINVGASNGCNEGRETFANSCNNTFGSNYGPMLNVMAPGARINTIDISGPAGYSNGTSGNGLQIFDDNNIEISGTSFSCPNAAGIMALILAYKPCLTYKQAKEILEKSAERVGPYTYFTRQGKPNGLFHEQMGYGRVNAAAALTLAATYNPDCYEPRVWLECIPIQGRLASTKSTARPIVSKIKVETYPNPFTAKTSIVYELPHAMPVNLKVYDFLGKEISTLRNGEMESKGKHEVEFIAPKIPDGIYYYVLEAGGQREIRRIVIFNND